MAPTTALTRSMFLFVVLLLNTISRCSAFIAGGSTQRQQQGSSVVARRATTSENIVHIDDSNYHKVINGDKPVLIDAYTQWYVLQIRAPDLYFDAECCS